MPEQAERLLPADLLGRKGNDVIAQGQRYTLSGNAALCLVERPDELLSNDWGVRRDGVFEVVPKDEVRAMLLLQPPAHRGHGSVRFDGDTAISNEVGNTLERGFVFRAGLVVDFPRRHGEEGGWSVAQSPNHQSISPCHPQATEACDGLIDEEPRTQVSHAISCLARQDMIRARVIIRCRLNVRP
jgi:hypothetical protein